MDANQFKKLMEKLEEIQENTYSNRESAYETEQLGNKIDRLIELLEKFLKTKNIKL